MDVPQQPEPPDAPTPGAADNTTTQTISPLILGCSTVLVLGGALLAVSVNLLGGLLVVVAGLGLHLLSRSEEKDPRPAPTRTVEVAAPTGQSTVTVTHAGERPEDVAWVWRQFRALDPAEQRTPEELLAALSSHPPVVLAEGVTHRWATDFAEALRRAGATVTVD